MLNFYLTQLINLLKDFPPLPIVIFPGDSNFTSLNLSGLSNITQHNQTYQLFKYILAKYAFINLTQANSYFIKINNIEFHLIYSTNNIKIESNINETANLIVRLYLLQFSNYLLLFLENHSYIYI